MVVYQDNLISISEDKIVFARYYFPTGKEKAVPLADIESVKVEKASIWNGKWRIHGTGDFHTWYPLDFQRPKRDRIFIAKVRGQWVDIGFTVENADAVEKILKYMKKIRFK